MERNVKPQIKICGVTTEEELRWLEEEEVEYAGFVLWEKSRRYLPIGQAGRLLETSNRRIKKVAVTVNPDAKLAEQIEEAGFDVLQVHGTLLEEVKEAVHLPIWQAVNLSGIEELEEITRQWEEAPFWGSGKISAILADAKEYGSGKTFGWEDFSETGKSGEQKRLFADFRESLRKRQIDFILAGGLTPENVEKGIRIFSPDIVDVSSGVERTGTERDAGRGKDREKIRRFVQNARQGCNRTDRKEEPS